MSTVQSELLPASLVDIITHSSDVIEVTERITIIERTIRRESPPVRTQTKNTKKTRRSLPGGPPREDLANYSGFRAPPECKFIRGSRPNRKKRVHLDECADSNSYWDALNRAGFDVTSTYDRGLSGAKDSAQLAFAVKRMALVVTHDSMFLSGLNLRHCGVFVCPPRFSAKKLIKTLRLLFS